MAAAARTTIKISRAAYARLSELAERGGVSRSKAIELLLDSDRPSEPPADAEEALLILSRLARQGNVGAAVALARLLVKPEHAELVENPLAELDELAAKRRERA